MGSTHDLAASGTRLFGLAVGPAKLQVKIYEFALYLDAKQVWLHLRILTMCRYCTYLKSTARPYAATCTALKCILADRLKVLL